jgi:hypothetical protein
MVGITINFIGSRNNPGTQDFFTRYIVFPQEQTRFHVPQSSLDQYLVLIKEWVPLVPAELTFNVDECGFSDWEDRVPQLVLIPCRVNNVTLHYPVDHGIRH